MNPFSTTYITKYCKKIKYIRYLSYSDLRMEDW